MGAAASLFESPRTALGPAKALALANLSPFYFSLAIRSAMLIQILFAQTLCARISCSICTAFRKDLVLHVRH